MSDEAIFREVDEEVRQDEAKRLWQRHGSKFTAFAAAVIAAVAAYEGYKYYTTAQSEKAAVVYFDALKKITDKKPEDALAALKAVPAGTGFATVAVLKQADVLAVQGKTDEAVAAYDAFAAAPQQDPLFADVARIKAAYALVDTKSPDELQKRLSQFETDASPWRHQAREILGLSAYRIKDYAKAKGYMDALLADVKTPDDMKSRARMMVQLLEPLLPAK
jgi:hypothetical protein